MAEIQFTEKIVTQSQYYFFESPMLGENKLVCLTLSSHTTHLLDLFAKIRITVKIATYIVLLFGFLRVFVQIFIQDNF